MNMIRHHLEVHWLLLVALFFSMLLTDGIWYSIGIFALLGINSMFLDSHLKKPVPYRTLEQDLIRVFKKRKIEVEEIVVKEGATKYIITVNRDIKEESE